MREGAGVGCQALAGLHVGSGAVRQAVLGLPTGEIRSGHAAVSAELVEKTNHPDPKGAATTVAVKAVAHLAGGS